MSIDVSWYDQSKSIIHYVFKGNWSWSDVYQAMEKAKSLLPETKERTDVIISYQSGTRLPESFLTNLQGIAKRQPEYAGLTIICGTNGVIKTFIELSRKSNLDVANYIWWVKNEEEAYKLIEDDRKRVQDNTKE